MRRTLLCLLLAGCAPVARQIQPPAQETAVEKKTDPSAWFSIIVVTKTNADLTDWLKALELHKNLRLTLAVSPPTLVSLTDPLKSQLKNLLNQGQSSPGQLELALRVAGDPILPLLENSRNAGSLPSGATLPEEPFLWPEDVQALLVHAKSQHKQAVAQSPAGLVPGGGSLSPGILSMAKKANIQWALLANPALARHTSYGLFQGPVACFLSRTIETRDLRAFPHPAVLAEKILDDVKPLLSQEHGSVPVIALTILEEEFMKTSSSSASDLVSVLADKISKNPAWALATPTEILSQGAAEKAPKLPEEAYEPSSWWGSLAPWIGEGEENRAWEMLALTRRALDSHKNSGAASSTSLAQAFDMIYAAESGSHFWWLGQDYNSGQDENLERSFRASLMAVYKLIGQEPPEALYQSSDQSKSAPTPTVSKTSGSMVVEKNSILWQDAKGDDRGPGDYFYPSGTIYPSGGWDLNSFKVSDEGEDIVFTITMAELPNPWASPFGFSLPLIDIYIDLNNFPGRGATNLLAERGAFVSSKDAWEYCVVITGWGAQLYRQTQDGSPAKVQAAKLKADPLTRKIHASLPKNILGRSPLKWGYLVIVMGYNRSAQEIPRPVPVVRNPDGSHFGGAINDKGAPAILDVLTHQDQNQEELLGVYKQAAAVVLPMVRAE